MLFNVLADTVPTNTLQAIDAIIDPVETRKVISMGIEMASHKKAEKSYNVGVIQT